MVCLTRFAYNLIKTKIQSVGITYSDQSVTLYTERIYGLKDDVYALVSNKEFCLASKLFK